MKISVGPGLKEVITLAYRADRSVLLVGPTGVGKSECLVQVARDLKIDHIVRDLSLMEPPDLAGIPQIRGRRTIYAPPSFLPDEGDERGGLLVFEELNRAPAYMRTTCMQLLTTRRLNDYELPKGWLPVAAINPAGDEYVGAEDMDNALMARFMRVEVEADVESWLTWAEENDVHPAVMEFVRSIDKIFGAPDSNPRAWKYVSDTLKASEKGRFSRNTRLVAIAGFVGDKLATTFLRTYAAGGCGLPSVSKVLRSYPTIQAMIRKWKKGGNTAALNSIVHQVLLYLQDPANEARAERNRTSRANLGKLLADLPAEHRSQVIESVPWLNAGAVKERKRTV